MDSIQPSEKDEKGNTIITIHTTDFYGKENKNSVFFDDGPFFGDNILNYNIYKIRALIKNDKIMRFYFFYREILTGELISTDTIKEKGDDSYEIKEITLEIKENITNFYLYTDTESIIGISFFTNRDRELVIGTANKKPKKIFQSKIVFLAFFWGINYEKQLGLQYFGGYYINRRDYVSVNNSGIFYMKHLLKKNQNLREEISKIVNMNKVSLEYKILVNLCLCPEYIFFNVMRYVGI